MMARQLGGVFGVAIGVAVFSGAGGYGSATAFGDGFAPAIGVAAASRCSGALSAAALPGRPGARHALRHARRGFVSMEEVGS